MADFSAVLREPKVKQRETGLQTLRSQPNPTSAQARNTTTPHTNAHWRRVRGRALVAMPATTSAADSTANIRTIKAERFDEFQIMSSSVQVLTLSRRTLARAWNINGIRCKVESTVFSGIAA
jgi:hypothetical protein